MVNRQQQPQHHHRHYLLLDNGYVCQYNYILNSHMDTMDKSLFVRVRIKGELSWNLNGPRVLEGQREEDSGPV